MMMKYVKCNLILILLAVAVFAVNNGYSFALADSLQLEGRWDLTVVINGKEYPSWLEIRHSGHSTMVGHFVSEGGSARPIAVVNVKGNSFNFSIPRQWEGGTNDLRLNGTKSGETISGTILYPDDKSGSFTGTRAPALRDKKKVTWGKPIPLIKGNNTTGWHTSSDVNQWVVQNGVLASPKRGSNLITDERFGDFKLHVEFKCPKNGNSGVYLRGRYEVQVTDSQGHEPLSTELGGVYGFLSPSEQVAKAPGEWQTYDITLIGRMLTVVANGVPIITNQEIPGITGGALDSKEGEPGPIMLQGDHEAIEYRNIVITPALK